MGLELDEILYSWMLRVVKRRRLNDKEILSRQVKLVDIKPRLTLLARAICGEPIDIFPAEREGGYKNQNFFLPIECALFPSKTLNLQFYLFRVVYLGLQRKLGYNWKDNKATDNQLSILTARETASKVLQMLFTDYPGLRSWYDEAVVILQNNTKKGEADLSWLYGRWMTDTAEISAIDKLTNFDNTLQPKTSKIEVQTTLHAKAVEEIESLTIDKQQQEDYVLMHSFEKIETAEEFNGNWRDFDSKDELKNHQEALEEMRMRFTVRVDDTVHSVYQADFVENTSVAESVEMEEKGYYISYDEWDYKKRTYIPDFCKVYPRCQRRINQQYYSNTRTKYKTILNGLRKILANVNNKQQQQRRQLQGEMFDLDALTDLYTDIHSGISPDERVYLSNRKKKKDIAILVLLDISLSSDGYVAGNRVIDVEKEASILFGEILDEFDITFAIDGFYSKTRNFSTYLTVKDFDENWQRAKYKVGAVEPSGYTRIGPALRHAGARMNAIDSKNKWIILLSDGKPNDYDRYEGKYGIQDIKQALRELNECKINTYALAIEAQARYYLPQMFGQNHYQILTSPEELLKALAKLYEKIRRG
ncbi:MULTISPECIES: nitric oxide reductase activation protein NorD [Sphingobacterium]|uniref:nitric oxide reductase activation protein NorD n=1 Tax=Sphingobacterium TaxID=28453 RepID=UPI0013DCBBF2|nr:MULTISPECIES: NorD protein [unclassified Sphingobacterium]